MDFSGKKVALIGLGVSNTALARFLVKKGAQVTGCDRKEPNQLSSYRKLQELGIELQLGPDYLKNLNRFSTLYISPGINKNLPELKKAESFGVEISTEIQVFLENCKGKTIGITGSSGKTTTTTLTGEILKKAGRKVYVGGNIGKPLIDEVDNIHPEDWVVLELSSFQLELVRISPNISVITNITPNHLDIHETMENYIEAKKGIYRYQSTDDFLVLNSSDPISGQLSREARGNVLFFSSKEMVSPGAFIMGEHFAFAQSNGELPVVEKVCKLTDLHLLGSHNRENALAAITAAKAGGVDNQAITSAIREFKGVPHRLELVGDIEGVKYYNDSIATTPTRAVAGINSFDRPIILLAGGYDKKLPFDLMAQAMPGKVREVYLLGQTKHQIAECVQQYAPEVQVNLCEDFTEAVIKAGRSARPGEVVLLSPGCASYGMFNNFEERGDLFRALVGDLAKSTVRR
jgi:UDP-N-acetylmuramoylalanine--D-glutamate ligase